MGRDENRKCTRKLFEKLDNVIWQNNSYVIFFKNIQRIDMEETALAAMENRPAKQTKMVFLQTSLDLCRYNEHAGDICRRKRCAARYRQFCSVSGIRPTTTIPITGLTWISWCTHFSFPLANEAGTLGWNTRRKMLHPFARSSPCCIITLHESRFDLDLAQFIAQVKKRRLNDCSMIDWSSEWSIDWLFDDRLVKWMIDWLIVWLIIDWLTAVC